MEVGAFRHLAEQFNFKPKCIVPLIVVGGGCSGLGINMSEKNHKPCNLFDNKFELPVIADNIFT